MLSVTDQALLLAAQGWLELGNHLEANEELDRIAPQSRSHPSVLMVRFDIYASAYRWEACIDIAEAAAMAAPNSADAWRRVLLAARHLGANRLRPVWASFAKQLPELTDDTWMLFEAACAAVTLGRATEAKSLLERSFATAENQGRQAFKKVRLAAVDEPILANILVA